MGRPWQPQTAALRVWAVEPYFGGSHKYFLRGLARHSCHDFTLLTLPGRHWKWRMQGGAVALAAQAAAGAAPAGPARARAPFVPAQAAPDLLFVSDMLDLPAFLTLVGSSVAATPTILYFHENQLTYPLPAGVERDLGYGMKNIVSALAAQRVLFNSGYHRSEFFAAAKELFAALPDEVPGWALAEIRRKSAVLPVGCDLRRLDGHRDAALREAAEGRWGDPARGPLLLWNQRWEYDKAPDVFLTAVRRLKKDGVPFRLAVAGSSHGAPQAEVAQVKAELSEHIVHWGRLPGDAEYAALLWASDVVVSTALHEFFGIAVVEALYCGCRPVLPWRLSYPELIPAAVHEDVLYREEELVPALVRALECPRPWSDDWQRTWVARFDWASLAPRYDAEIRRCRQAGLAAREAAAPPS